MQDLSDKLSTISLTFSDAVDYFYIKSYLESLPLDYPQSIELLGAIDIVATLCKFQIDGKLTPQ